MLSYSGHVTKKYRKSKGNANNLHKKCIILYYIYYNVQTHQ